MSDAEVSDPGSPQAAPEVAKSAKPAQAKKQDNTNTNAKRKRGTYSNTRPTVAIMVMTSIRNLNDRKGSSMPAIKKYMAAYYNADVVQLGPRIRRFIKEALEDGRLIQTAGVGAAGSFKVNKAVVDIQQKNAKKRPNKKAAVAKKAKKPKSPAKTTVRKTVKKTTKKVTKKPKTKAAKKPKKAKKPAKKPAKKSAAKKSKTTKK